MTTFTSSCYLILSHSNLENIKLSYSNQKIQISNINNAKEGVGLLKEGLERVFHTQES